MVAVGSPVLPRQMLACRQGSRWRAAALLAALLLICAAVLWSPRWRGQHAPLQAAPSSAREGGAGSSGCPVLSTMPRGCQHLRHVCLDQGQAVLYSWEFQPRQASTERPVHPLPVWKPRMDENYPYITDDGSNSDYLAVPGLQPQPPLTFRPVSAGEASPDLASPQVRAASSALPAGQGNRRRARLLLHAGELGWHRPAASSLSTTNA